MATTAAARRSEPSSSSECSQHMAIHMQNNPDTHASITSAQLTCNAAESTENQPLRSPARAQPMASRASTPSISPLSTASRPAVDASESMPDVAMEDPAVQVDVENPNGFDGAVENALGDQDDCSSSLSEPEYESEDDLRHNGDDRGAAQSVEDIGLRVAEEDDSEAETERLEPTPHKLQKHTDSLGRTPSKLSHAATVEDELSEPPSPLQELGVGAASSTSTIATSGQSCVRSPFVFY